MAYSQQTWNDGDAATPLSGARLTHMEQGIGAAEQTANKNANNGYAGLDSVGKLPHLRVKELPGKVSADDYGVLGDDATDNLTALNACITALPAQGGDIDLPPGRVKCAGEYDLMGKAIRLVGRGGKSRSIGDAHGTVLVYSGAGGVGSIFVKLGTCSTLQSLCVEGNSLADFVVRVANDSIGSGYWDVNDCFVANPRGTTGTAFYTGPAGTKLGYVTSSDIHGGAAGKTAAWVDTDDVIFRGGVVLAKGDPCLNLDAGGFRWWGGDCSGEGMAITDGGLMTVTAGNHAIIDNVFFGTYTGSGSTPGAKAAIVIKGGVSRLSLGPQCQYAFNNPSADNVHDYIRMDGSTKIRACSIRGQMAAPIVDSPSNDAGGGVRSVERFRYFYNRANTNVVSDELDVTNIILPGTGLYTARPDLLGKMFVDADNTTNTTATHKLTQNRGQSTSTPGAVSTVNIAHGLYGTPRFADARPSGTNARGAPAYDVTFTSTNVVLTFASNLTAATSYTWNWEAEM